MGKQLRPIVFRYMADNNNRKDKHRKNNKKSTKFREMTWSEPKKHKIFNKNNKYRYAFFQRCSIFLLRFHSIRFANNVIIWEGNEIDS